MKPHNLPQRTEFTYKGQTFYVLHEGGVYVKVSVYAEKVKIAGGVMLHHTFNKSIKFKDFFYDFYIGNENRPGYEDFIFYTHRLDDLETYNFELTNVTSKYKREELLEKINTITNEIIERRNGKTS